MAETTVSAKIVLVLDDSEIVLGALRAVLENAGFVVLTAADLAEFEAHLDAARPDVVVLDVLMPEVYGHDVGRVLREVRKVRAPILLFSSLNDTLLAARVAEAKLDGFVSKSGGVGALVERLHSLVG
jgi:DNA-binding response OmpR family regulator